MVHTFLDALILLRGGRPVMDICRSHAEHTGLHYWLTMQIRR